MVFFFQAEDGIRDWSVTGVQTCALPICKAIAELRGDGLTDGASSTDEEDAHDGATAPRGALFRACCSTSRKYCRLAPVSEHTSDQTRRRAPGRHHPPWPRA